MREPCSALECWLEAAVDGLTPSEVTQSLSQMEQALTTEDSPLAKLLVSATRRHRQLRSAERKALAQAALEAIRRRLPHHPDTDGQRNFQC